MRRNTTKDEEKLCITFLTVEKRDGNRCRSIDITSPSWGAIEGAIRGLDADHWSALTLEAAGKATMAIEGGAGRYLAHVSTGGGGVKQLVNPSKSEETVELVVAGHESRFSKRLLVNLRTVLKAARQFSQTGAMEKSLFWEDRSGRPSDSCNPNESQDGPMDERLT